MSTQPTLSAPDETVNVTAPTAQPVPTLGTPPSDAQVQGDQQPATPPSIYAAQQAAAIDAHHHGRLMAALDALGTGLGGSHTLDVTAGKDGTIQITPRSSTIGEKFSRAAVNALRGMAAGASAGPGPGNLGRAAGAGITAGMQGAQQDLQQKKDDTQQNVLNAQRTAAHNANMALLNQRIAAGSFDLDRNKAEFQNAEADRTNSIYAHAADNPNNKVLPIIKSADDLPELLKSQPDIIKDHTNGQIALYPLHNADGSFKGLQPVYLDKEWGERRNDKPVTFHRVGIDPDAPLGSTPKMMTVTVPAGAMTNKDIMVMQQGEDAKAIKISQDVHEQNTKDLTAKSEAGLRTAQGTEQRAAANKNNAEADKARSEAAMTQGQMGEAQESQAQQIASGDVKPLNLSRNNTYNKAIMQRVYELNPKYSDALYNTKQAFKNGGDSASVVSLATAMEHLDRLHANSAKVGFAPMLSSGLTPESTAYLDDAKLFTQEAGKLVKNGVLGQEEYEDLKGGLMSRSAKNRMASIEELTNLMGGKVKGLAQKYKTGTGMDLRPADFFDADTQNRLQRFGVLGGRPAAAPAAAAPPAAPAAPVAPPPGASAEVHDAQGNLIGHAVNGQYVPLQQR